MIPKRRPGRPPKVKPMEDAKPIQDTPEFAAAVAAGVKSALASLVPDLRQSILDDLKAAQPAPEPTHFTGDRFGDERWATNLAVAIAQLSDQGTGKGKRVSPELLTSRQRARDAMVALLIDAKATGKRAEYQLRHKQYLNEMLIDPLFKASQQSPAKPTVITWAGVPNEGMIPVSDTAKEIYAVFLDSIGHIATPMEEMPAYMTAGGLVVNGRTAPSRRSPHEIVSDAVEGTELILNHQKINPGDAINVLGTVMEPAMHQV